MDETWPAAKPKKETKIEKKLFLWLAILVVIWLLFSIAAQNLAGGNDTDTNANSPPATVPPGSGKETVSVSFKALAGEQIVLDKTITVEKGANAFEEMKKIAAVETQMSAYGAFVTSINGVAPTEKQYWALYVDGQMSEKGIDAITLEKGTAIEWRLE